MWIIILPLHSKTTTMSQDTPNVWKIKDDLSNIELRMYDQSKPLSKKQKSHLYCIQNNGKYIKGIYRTKRHKNRRRLTLLK